MANLQMLRVWMVLSTRLGVFSGCFLDVLDGGFFGCEQGLVLRVSDCGKPSFWKPKVPETLPLGTVIPVSILPALVWERNALR